MEQKKQIARNKAKKEEEQKLSFAKKTEQRIKENTRKYYDRQ